MAHNPPHLQNRNGRYFARMVVPKELRPWVDGKTEFREALGPDRRTALRLLHGAVARIQHKIAVATRKAANAGQLSKRPTLYPLSPKEIAIRHYLHSIDVDEEFRRDWRYASFGYVDEQFAARLNALCG